MAKRLAVVTGANKGLGFALVKALCPVFDGDVLLTARDEGRGKSSVQKLETEGLHPIFYQLDVTDPESIAKLQTFLQDTYGGIDLLINNAGVLIRPDSGMPIAEQVEQTVKVNYFGVVNVSKALFPLLRPQARVCNMSSRAGMFSYHKCSDSIKKRFTNPSITLDELTSIMQEFVISAKDGTTVEKGFPLEAYGISKTGLTVLTRIQQKEIDQQGKDNILINACTPGYVNTDMTLGKGTLSIEEGIVTPLYISLLPSSSNSPRGAMLADKELLDWENPSNAP